MSDQFLRDGPCGVSLDHFPDVEANARGLGQILQEHQTPLFAGESQIVMDRIETLRRALASDWGRHAIAYSFKTNYALARSAILPDNDVWAEVVSGREYEMAREVGYPGQRIVFNGPLKTDTQLARALGDGALVNINDCDELDRVLALAEAEQTRFEVGIRVSSQRVGLRRPTRFGFSLDDDEARLAVERIRESDNLSLVGLHLHLQGDTDGIEVHRRAAAAVSRFFTECVGGTLKYLDMGGGFPAHGPKPRSRDQWDPRPIEEYVHVVCAELRSVMAPEPLLIFEPGRYLVCDSVIFLSRVVRAEPGDDSQTLVSDGAISMQPLIHYCPQVVRAFSPDLEPRRGEPVPTLVYGSSCREDDVLYHGLLAATRVGDYLVHYAAGAYNSNMSPEFIFELPPTIFF